MTQFEPYNPPKIARTTSQRLNDLEEALAYQYQLITVLKETLEAIATGLSGKEETK
jgi:uncharacterized coiled-coil protein SlyX